MSRVGWFLGAVGASIALLWAVLLTAGEVPEVDEGRIDIWFHLTAEFALAAVLLTAAFALRRRWRTAPFVGAVAAGALGYSVVNSAGYYAESGDWAVVAAFGVLLLAVAAAVTVLLRGASRWDREAGWPGETRNRSGTAGSVGSGETGGGRRPGRAEVRGDGRGLAGPTRLLMALLAVLSVGAVGGGVTFLVDPSGSAAGLDTPVLAETPFTTFTWPGVALLVLFAAPSATVLLRVWWLRRRRGGRPADDTFVSGRGSAAAGASDWSWWVSVGVGVALTVWIAVQVVVIPFSWLQPAMFVVGAAIVGLAAKRAVRRDLARPRPPRGGAAPGRQRPGSAMLEA